MVMRLLAAEDREAHSRLMAEAFGGGRRPAPSAEPAAPAEATAPESPTLGIFDGPRLVAAATTHDLHVTWGAHDAPMGGVAGVACVADQRGRGHVNRLLAESLRLMRDRGQYLSGLYPFAWAFYRRHGWDWVGEKRVYTVPTSELQRSAENWYLRCYDGPEAQEMVRPVYDTFARRYRSMATRLDASPNFWEGALKHQDNRTTYVHVYRNPESGAVEGYLTFRYPSEGDAGKVDELVAITPAGYRGMLAALHCYGTQVKKVEFSAPADDILPLHVMHWDVETKVRPSFMGRIVDVPAAFAALQPDIAHSGSVILRVADGQCDWNNGTFALTIEGGRVAVAVSDQAPGIEIDIQTLTQAYWGQPSLALLRTAGRLAVTDEAQYATLLRLLPPTVCYIQDFF